MHSLSRRHTPSHRKTIRGPEEIIYITAEAVGITIKSRRVGDLERFLA